MQVSGASGAAPMAKPLGPIDDSAAQAAGRQRPGSLQVEKKKGCKQSKCSKWKGGKCRCGRG
jgi:hypothetical protein